MTATTPTRTVRAALLDPRTDADLLSAFLTRQDHEAFAALVHRHGPLVLGVCRRALGTTADADDAFQATFLVLVKRAAAIPWRANLGPWLFGVAHRIAAKARFRRNRRFALEKQVDAMPQPETTAAEPDDLSRLFDEELANLPEEMRRAVVLCELQGLSRTAAAKQLKISEGTLSSRLGRARKKLAAAFSARGVTLAVPAVVGVSSLLTSATVRAAVDPTGAVPAGVSFLVQEALKAMTVSKLKIGAVLAAVALGCTLLGLTARGDDKPKAVQPPGPPQPPWTPQTPKAQEQPKSIHKEESMREVLTERMTRKLQPTPVATVNGKEVSREEFAEYLIWKYGRQEIEQFVNNRVILEAAAKSGADLTKADVGGAIFEYEKASGTFDDPSTKANPSARLDFMKAGMWAYEVRLPQRLLEEMCRKEITVTDDELKEYYERKHGEQRTVQMIVWEKGKVTKEVATAAHTWAKSSAEEFDRVARVQSNPSLAAARGVVPPMGKARRGPNQVVNEAVFALKSGEVSGLIDTEAGWVAVRLVEVRTPSSGLGPLIPGYEPHKGDDIRKEVMQEKLKAAAAELFAKLKAEAKPVYHLTPEGKK